jgi:hypothetical protein
MKCGSADSAEDGRSARPPGFGSQRGRRLFEFVLALHATVNLGPAGPESAK